MRPHTFILATCACAAFLLGAARAQSNPTQTSPQPAYVVPLDALRDYPGQFQMPDGTSLTVAIRNRRLVVDMAGQPPTVLVAVAPGTFASLLGDIELKFQQADNGNVYGVAIRRTLRAS